MSIANLVLGLGDGSSVHRECRECGLNLDADAEGCPECGGGVSRYDLS